MKPNNNNFNPYPKALEQLEEIIYCDELPQLYTGICEYAKRVFDKYMEDKTGLYALADTCTWLSEEGGYLSDDEKRFGWNESRYNFLLILEQFLIHTEWEEGDK